MADLDQERMRRDVARWAQQSVPGVAPLGDQLAAHVLALLAALAEAETQEREKCIRDLCVWCEAGERPVRREAEHPEVEWGMAWFHPAHMGMGGHGAAVCEATTIHERAFQEEAQQAAPPEKGAGT